MAETTPSPGAAKPHKRKSNSNQAQEPLAKKSRTETDRNDGTKIPVRGSRQRGAQADDREARRSPAYGDHDLSAREDTDRTSDSDSESSGSQDGEASQGRARRTAAVSGAKDKDGERDGSQESESTTPETEGANGGRDGAAGGNAPAPGTGGEEGQPRDTEDVDSEDEPDAEQAKVRAEKAKQARRKAEKAAKSKDSKDDDDESSDEDEPSWSLPNPKMMYPVDRPPPDLGQAWFTSPGLGTKGFTNARMFKELRDRGDTAMSKTLFLVVTHLSPALYMHVLGMVRYRLVFMDKTLWWTEKGSNDKRELSSTRSEYRNMINLVSKGCIEAMGLRKHPEFSHGSIKRQFLELYMYELCARECAALAPLLKKCTDKTKPGELPWKTTTRMIVSFQGVNDFRDDGHIDTRMPKQVDANKVELNSKYLVVARRTTIPGKPHEEYHKAKTCKPLAFKINQLTDWNNKVKLRRLLGAINHYWKKDLEAADERVGLEQEDLRLVWHNPCSEFGNAVFIEIISSKQLEDALRGSAGTWEDDSGYGGLWLFVVRGCVAERPLEFLAVNPPDVKGE